MNNYSKEQLNRLLEASFETPKEGDIIKAKIIKRTENGVLLNIGLKAEGFLPLEEFSNPDEAVEGKEIYVYLEAYENREGFPVISKRKADFQFAWDKIRHLYETGELAMATVRKRIKGGFTVDLLSVEAFLPSSQIEFKSQSNIDGIIGQTMDVKIVKINMQRKNIVVSRKLAVEEEQERVRKKIFNEIKTGDTIDGVVKNITDYGGFIDIGGVDALLHISDISWTKITHPAEVLKSNSKIKVKVLVMDRSTGRIAVGLKQLMPHPWESIEKKYRVGAKIKCKVANLAEHGAFVEIEKEIEGFIPATEMSWSKEIKKPSAILKVSDVVDAIVLSVDRDEKKIILGMKQAKPDPWSEVDERHKVGQRVTVKVTNLKDFGAFVRLPNGIEGLIHINDFFWDKKVKKASDYLKKGQRVEASILSIDRKNRRISLSIKHTKDDPFTRFVEEYSEGTKIIGKVSDILPKGIRVTLREGIEEFIPSNFLGRRGKKPRDLYKLGEEIEVVIKKINTKIRHIILSERESRKQPPKKKEVVLKPSPDKFTIADIIASRKEEKKNEEVQ